MIFPVSFLGKSSSAPMGKLLLALHIPHLFSLQARKSHLRHTISRYSSPYIYQNFLWPQFASGKSVELINSRLTMSRHRRWVWESYDSFVLPIKIHPGRAGDDNVLFMARFAAGRMQTGRATMKQTRTNRNKTDGMDESDWDQTLLTLKASLCKVLVVNRWHSVVTKLYFWTL